MYRRDKHVVLFTREWLMDFVLDATVEELREKTAHLEELWKRGTPADSIEAIVRERDALPKALVPQVQQSLDEIEALQAETKEPTTRRRPRKFSDLKKTSMQ